MAGLLDGVRVVDRTGEAGQLAGRILADLGAEVVLVEAGGASPVRRLPPFAPDGTSLRFAALNAGKSVVGSADDAAFDIVLSHEAPPGPPTNVWVAITPYGLTGPRAGWRGSDLTGVASGGGMYPTGDPDRAPIRAAEPTAYNHVAAEAVVGALTALWSGLAQVVDVSIQETMLITSMTGPARFPTEKNRGKRRGAVTGRTREIWQCADGFVSFGLRGGKARLRNLETITRFCVEAGVPGADVLAAMDWSAYTPNGSTPEQLAAITEPIAAFFATRTMAELYQYAVDTGLMLAPANSPKELYANAQLAARDFFDEQGMPRHFVQIRHPQNAISRTEKGRKATPGGTRDPEGGGGGGAWGGVKILEFGSGAAGPIAARYFADHGATVVRVESSTRPDFLRMYSMGPDNPHGVEGSQFFSILNAGKLGVTLNMKDARAVAIARQLVQWADAVSENFAPKAMASWGLDFATLSAEKPDLVMVSACLQGNTGPHKDYPGFGGQGAALSGYNFLTGWPDREPVGPAGTITDSLAPRYVAAALAAGLHYRRRTGQGVYLDLAQVEAALYTLSPWLLDYYVNGHVGQRSGNRSDRAAPHGAFRAAGEDRWVALAAWDDAEWATLARLIGVSDPGLARLTGRLERIDELEALVESWTQLRGAEETAELLQSAGLDAYAVLDWGDLHDDPQLAHRRHFVSLVHPVMGEQLYEEVGFRLTATPGGVRRPGPTLGQHNDAVLGGFLGIPAEELAALAAEGVMS